MSTSIAVALGHSLAYRRHDVLTPDGLSIAVQDWERNSGQQDVLLIHGFSQSHLCWLHQLASPLREKYRLLTYDLRGHGESDKPRESFYYNDPTRWAGEVSAVIEQAGLNRPILVAWSYAGRIVLDYLSSYGDSALAGLVMVSATSAINNAFLGSAAPLLARMGDISEEIANRSTRQFLEQCTCSSLPASELNFMLEYNLQTPSYVRRAMSGRPANYDDTLRAIEVPLLAVHGEKDKVILPTMSRNTSNLVKHGREIIYRDTGHAPFWEAPSQFNEDLVAFALTLKERG